MKLASLGYTNYVKILDTAEYGGIPQHRERVFMVSLLNKQVYNFPAKLELKHSLSYFLNKNVEEKYYLNQETIDRITAWKSFENPIEKAIDLGKKERKKERESNLSHDNNESCRKSRWGYVGKYETDNYP